MNISESSATSQLAVHRPIFPTNLTATTALVLQVGGGAAAVAGSEGVGVATILQATVLSTLALLGSTLNALALIVFLRKPALRATSNRFVLSLLVGNLLTAATLLPSPALRQASVVRGGPRKQHSAWRQGWAALATLAVSASVLSVLGIALDRHSAVLAPLRYSAQGTRRRARFILVFSWGLAALQAAVPPLLGFEPPSLLLSPVHEHFSPLAFRLAYAGILLALGLALPVFALCLIYTQMYTAARGNSERTRRHSIGGECGGKIGGRLGRQSSVFSREEGRAVKTAALVIFSFMLCWAPYFLALLIAPNLEPVRFVALCGALSNGVVTPFVYVFRGEAVRQEAAHVLCWWKPPPDKSPGANQGPSSPGGTQYQRARPPPLGYFEAASTEQESLSVHSFTTECRHCGALNAADFVATYEVVPRPTPSPPVPPVAAQTAPGIAPLAPAEDSAGLDPRPEVKATPPRRHESVTFRVALMPRGSRRCTSCIRQNSDSSCGSGQPLLLRRDSSKDDSTPSTPQRRPRSDPELELQLARPFHPMAMVTSVMHNSRAKASTLTVTQLRVTSHHHVFQETSLTSSGLGRSLESLELNESPTNEVQITDSAVDVLRGNHLTRPRLQRLPAIDDEEYFV